MFWVDKSKKVIDQVRLDTGLTGKKLRTEPRKHYPFAERRGYPYKAWLNEVADVCGRSRRTKSDTLDMFDETIN